MQTFFHAPRSEKKLTAVFRAESTFDGFYAVSTNLENLAEEIAWISTGEVKDRGELPNHEGYGP